MLPWRVCVITVDLWDDLISMYSDRLQTKSVKAIQKCTQTSFTGLSTHTYMLLPLVVKNKTKKRRNADQLWYFFASRNHRVYPICREEAVRLLRSTRMARAYSEGAYSSDYDYERYWHALLLHLCIHHLVVSSSCPSSVFNLSVILHVMTENDILSDIGFC